MNNRITITNIARYYVTIIFVFITALCSARGNEPGNNLGKTISELRQVFPNARYVRTEAKGDFLTSSSCHPKVFVKEFCYFLMSCHQHCLGVNLLVQR